MSGKNSVIFRFFLRHNWNKSPCKNIFLVSYHVCTSPLVRAPPQLTRFPSPTPCAVEGVQRLRFGNIQSTNKFTGKPKTKNQHLHLNCAPSVRSMEQPNISYKSIYQRRVSTCQRWSTRLGAADTWRGRGAEYGEELSGYHELWGACHYDATSRGVWITGIYG